MKKDFTEAYEKELLSFNNPEWQRRCAEVAEAIITGKGLQNIVLEPSIYDELKKRADEKGISVSNLVNTISEEYLKN